MFLVDFHFSLQSSLQESSLSVHRVKVSQVSPSATEHMNSLQYLHGQRANTVAINSAVFGSYSYQITKRKLLFFEKELQSSVQRVRFTAFNYST